MNKITFGIINRNLTPDLVSLVCLCLWTLVWSTFLWIHSTYIFFGGSILKAKDQTCIVPLCQVPLPFTTVALPVTWIGRFTITTFTRTLHQHATSSTTTCSPLLADQWVLSAVHRNRRSRHHNTATGPIPPRVIPCPALICLRWITITIAIMITIAITITMAATIAMVTTTNMATFITNKVAVHIRCTPKRISRVMPHLITRLTPLRTVTCPSPALPRRPLSSRLLRASRWHSTVKNQASSPIGYVWMCCIRKA